MNANSTPTGSDDTAIHLMRSSSGTSVLVFTGIGALQQIYESDRPGQVS